LLPYFPPFSFFSATNYLTFTIASEAKQAASFAKRNLVSTRLRATHCERSEAIQNVHVNIRLPRRPSGSSQ